MFQHHDRGLTKFVCDDTHQDPSNHCCVSSHTTLVTRPPETTTQLIMHLGNIECRVVGF